MYNRTDLLIPGSKHSLAKLLKCVFVSLVTPYFKPKDVLSASTANLTKTQFGKILNTVQIVAYSAIIETVIV